MNKSAAKKMKQRSAGKPDIELGKRIRLRRVEQKISQAELGDKLGVSFQQVQNTKRASIASVPSAFSKSPPRSMCPSRSSTTATARRARSKACCFSTARSA